MSKIKTSKDLNIETLRGLAILLMVTGHIIGYSSDMGLKVPDDSNWRFFYYVLQYIRMPLFTVISGYVYAYKPLSRFASTNQFIGRKINRLLFPLVVVGTLFFIVQFITPGTNSHVQIADIWRIYFFHYAHFWFLQGMMVVFLILTLLERYNLLSTLKSALVCILISAGIFLTDQPHLSFFSLNEVPFLLTFFLLGLTLKRFYDAIFIRQTLIVAGVLFCSAMIYQLTQFNFRPFSPILNGGLTLAVGATSCILLIRYSIQNGKLIWLGNFSYGIYLFHVFGTAAARMVLLKLHVTNNAVHLVGGLVLGLGLPIILQLIVPRNSILALMFFGEKYVSKKDSQSGGAKEQSNLTQYQDPLIDPFSNKNKLEPNA
jgi:glucan biosynthesis protein C